MDLNSFFDSATPAQINQLTASPPQQEQSVQQQQQHPAIAMAQLDQLPEVESQPDLPTPQEPVQQEAPVQAASQQEEVVETKQQQRFREVREAKLKAEWERDELRRRLQSYEESRKAPAKEEEVADEDYGIEQDAILEGKDFIKAAKIIEKRAEQRIEKKYRQQQQAMMQNVVENRLRMEMPDIASVLSEQNVQKLNQMYPELAQSLASNPDEYTKAKAAYQLMKRLNIVVEPQQDNYDYEADRRKIAQNMAKPRPVQAATQRQSPLSASNSYDGELNDSIKASYWKEMQKAMKG